MPVTTSANTFDVQPFYEIVDEEVLDRRVLDVVSELPDIDRSLLSPQQQRDAERRSERRMHPFSNADQRGSDGDDFSGFVAIADIHTADGRDIAVVDSWQANNETGIPAPHCSWSAEFDDPSVARDFWENHWTPRFRGGDFVEGAREYLDAHPDIPRRSIRIQELGLLKAWHSQRLGEHIFMEKFSTAADDLVRTPSRYERDDGFEAGKVYVVPVRSHGLLIDSRVAKTCLAAFLVEGGERLGGLGWRTEPDSTFVQWSDGKLESYAHPISPDIGPTPLTTAGLTS